mmetsp:Transcript_5966/g.12984  ORF Transcript_5966/g.12984 Transcript_5966/m.12984 type:complete len:384 (-) Transcript_5966:288-1439(-)
MTRSNLEQSTTGGRCRPAVATTAAAALLSLAVLSGAPTPAEAWGSSSSSNMEYYSTSQRRSYLYESSKINIEYVGCAVGYTRVNGDEGGGGDEDGGGCLENSSEDGLSYWFMMSNCKRAQVVFNVFSGGGCSESTFQESVITRGGLSEFAATMSAYDSNTPITEDSTYNLPACEYDGDNGYYLNVGCGTNGMFTIERFSDQYCLSHVDTLYALDDVNSALKSLKSCHSASNGDPYSSLAAYLIPSGQTCTSADSRLCTNFAGYSTSGVPRRAHSSSASASWANKFKYVLGSILLAASVMMFLGILFTNRRRRRAMMHRKFRQAAARKKRSSRSKSRSHRSRSRSGRESSRARSKSKSRGHSKSRSQSKSRSERDDTGSGGVLT